MKVLKAEKWVWKNCSHLEVELDDGRVECFVGDWTDKQVEDRLKENVNKVDVEKSVKKSRVKSLEKELV